MAGRGGRLSCIVASFRNNWLRKKGEERQAGRSDATEAVKEKNRFFGWLSALRQRSACLSSTLLLARFWFLIHHKFAFLCLYSCIVWRPCLGPAIVLADSRITAAEARQRRERGLALSSLSDLMWLSLVARSLWLCHTTFCLICLKSKIKKEERREGEGALGCVAGLTCSWLAPSLLLFFQLRGGGGNHYPFS